MARDRNGRAQQAAHERSAVTFLPVFSQLVAELDVDPARACEDFDRLPAPVGRARQDPLQTEVAEELRQGFRLSASAPVERTSAIVSDPVVAIARAGMPDQQHAARRVSTTPYGPGARGDATPSALPPWRSRGAPPGARRSGLPRTRLQRCPTQR